MDNETDQKSLIDALIFLILSLSFSFAQMSELDHYGKIFKK